MSAVQALAAARSIASAREPFSTGSSSPISPNRDGSRGESLITSSGEPSGSRRPLRMPK